MRPVAKLVLWLADNCDCCCCYGYKVCFQVGHDCIATHIYMQTYEFVASVCGLEKRERLANRGI